MKLKKSYLVMIVIYFIFFLIGPWHFYGDLKNNEKTGLYLKDEVYDLKYSSWVDDEISICLEGRVDGKDSDVFLKVGNDFFENSFFGGEMGEGGYKALMKLNRTQYDTQCTRGQRKDFVLVMDYFNYLQDHYNYNNIVEKIKEYDEKKLVLLALSKDEGVNRYKNYIGVYAETELNTQFAWISLEGVYHQKVDPYWFDYAWVLIKDFFTMPYQWLQMFRYVSGGIG